MYSVWAGQVLRMSFINPVYCTLLKNQEFLLGFPLKTSRQGQALPINIVIIRQHCELNMKVQRSYP